MSNATCIISAGDVRKERKGGGGKPHPGTSEDATLYIRIYSCCWIRIRILEKHFLREQNNCVRSWGVAQLSG
jgi:hypothetical protein